MKKFDWKFLNVRKKERKKETASMFKQCRINKKVEENIFRQFLTSAKEIGPIRAKLTRFATKEKLNSLKPKKKFFLKTISR